MKWLKSWRKKRKSIQSRLILMVTSLMVATFLIIIIVFNLLFTRYVETTATDLLSFSEQPIGSVPSAGEPFGDWDVDPRESAPPFAVSVQRIDIDEEYQPVFPNDRPVTTQQETDTNQFLEGLTSQQVALDQTENARLEWEDNLYYYSITENTGVIETISVYFINMTDLYSLEQSINQILLFVMLIALAFSFAITYALSAKIANPMKKLAFFAKEIGEGNYHTLNDEFRDEELQRLKKAMNETSYKLKQYDSEQRSFFQNASHELRTPLQIIKTTAEGLEYGIIEKKKGTELIKKETDELSKLVEDILFLSRLDSKSSDKVLEENDLRETISYSAERYRHLFEQKGITLEYDFQQQPVCFKYDERDFERCFQNLLSNALRYSKGLIRISCREKQDRIILSIFDNGTGISKEDLPYVFDRFYFGEKGAHGIGLSIVKSIVTSYHGRIEVSSNENGTTFTVFLNK